MATAYCHKCDTYIDLDKDLEHFEDHLQDAAPALLDSLKMALAIFEKQRDLLKLGTKDIPCPREEALDKFRKVIREADPQ